MNATKKFFLLLTVTCGLVGTMASCEDCQECTDSSGYTEEKCDEELKAARRDPFWNC